MAGNICSRVAKEEDRKSILRFKINLHAQGASFHGGEFHGDTLFVAPGQLIDVFVLLCPVQIGWFFILDFGRNRINRSLICPLEIPAAIIDRS